MTPIKATPIVRRGTESLGHAFGPDRNRRLVIALQAIGDEDYIQLRPHGTRRSELVRLIDVYRFALRCRVNRELLEKARVRKEKLAAQRAARRLERAHKKLFRTS